MENQKNQVLQKLKDAQNVLVTVSKNPSVDQLSAAIGMTLVLNKMGKHATAVFSGTVPSTIEFLKPEETIEKTTDSLRDFIIALDKSKADKLRYKVEDQHVKIFITPYHTTITQDDLDFSHGDFNVDVVLALGVHEQQDLDQAITAHGRILHDATVVAVNTEGSSELGGINIVDQEASSLSEVIASLSEQLQEGVFDTQIATAYLTGIVAETDRFSNEKTKPTTMSISAKLMAAGANQQLVATKLEAAAPLQETATTVPKDEPVTSEKPKSDGSLDIDHSHDAEADASEPTKDNDDKKDVPEDDTDSKPEPEEKEAPEKPKNARPHRIIEPPSRGGKLTAAGDGEQLDPSTDPLSLPPVNNAPILTHHDDEAKTPVAPQEEPKEKPEEVPAQKPDIPAPSEPITPPAAPEPPQPPAPAVETPQPVSPPPPPPEPQRDVLHDPSVIAPEPPKEEPQASMPPEPPTPAVDGTKTLDSIEQSIDSPHQHPVLPDTKKPEESASEAPDISQLQSAVSDALASGPDGGGRPDPISALNANPVDLNLGHEEQSPKPHKSEVRHDYLDVSQLDENTGLPKDSTPPAPDVPQQPPLPPNTFGAPPPGPPPMMPPSPQNGDDDNLNLPPINQ